MAHLAAYPSYLAQCQVCLEACPAVVVVAPRGGLRRPLFVGKACRRLQLEESQVV